MLTITSMANPGRRGRSMLQMSVSMLLPAMLTLLGGFNLATAQQTATVVHPAPDGAGIDAILGALYESISGPAGEARDWDRLRSLFIPGARMIPTGRRSDGTGTHAALTVEEYIESNGALLVEIGFRETEIGRILERFGNIAHAYSAYEAFRESEAKPLMRGVNSIQLWFDGSRWWIAGLMWQQESPEQPIPERFLVPPA